MNRADSSSPLPHPPDALAIDRGSPNLRVQIIGAPEVGKTSFLGAIGLLAQNAQGSATVAGHTLVTLLDSHSKRRLDDLRQQFAAGHWPEKTVQGETFALRLHSRGHSITVSLDDIAGEVFQAAMRRGDQGDASQQLTGLIADADLLMLMIDGGQLDSDAAIAEADLIQAVAEKADQHAAASGPAAGRPLRVAVVVTKADLCRQHVITTPRQAEKRVAKRLPALTAFLQQHADEVRWFPLSVCGYAPATSNGTSLRFSPTGFDRLFDYWVSLVVPPRRLVWRPLLVTLFLLIAGGFAAMKYRTDGLQEQRSQIQNEQLRIEDLPTQVAEENLPQYRQRLLQTLEQAASDIGQASTLREVDAILRRSGSFPPQAQRVVAQQLETLEATALQRKEQLLAERIQAVAVEGNDTAIREAVDQYLAMFPQGPHAENARSLLTAATDRKQSQQRSEIRSLLVRDAGSLERKLELIGVYLDQPAATLSADDRQRIGVAVEAARLMLRPAQYDVTLVRTAGLDRARAHGVTVMVDGQQVAKFDDSGSVAEKIWNRPFTVRWQIGQRVELTLDNYRYSNNTIAYFDVPGPLGVLVLAKRNQASRFGADYVSNPPAVSLSLKCAQLPDATVKALEEWIYPGDSW